METSQRDDVRSKLPQVFDRNGRRWNHYSAGTVCRPFSAVSVQMKAFVEGVDNFNVSI